MYYGKVLGKPKIERPDCPSSPGLLPLAEMSQRIGGGGWRNGGEGPPKLFSIQWDKRAKELCLLFFFFVFSATVKGAYQHFALRYLLIILLRFLFFFAKFAEARTNTLFFSFVSPSSDADCPSPPNRESLKTYRRKASLLGQNGRLGFLGVKPARTLVGVSDIFRETF